MNKRAILIFASVVLSGCFEAPPPPAPDAKEFLGKWIRAQYDKEYLTVTLENAPALTFRPYTVMNSDPPPQLGDLIDAKTVAIRGQAGYKATILADGTLLLGRTVYHR